MRNGDKITCIVCKKPFVADVQFNSEIEWVECPHCGNQTDIALYGLLEYFNISPTDYASWEELRSTLFQAISEEQGRICRGLKLERKEECAD